MAPATKSEVPRPEKAIEFLGKKVKVETEKWDDLKWGEHAHALTVAHSTNAGVLDEIHRLLNDAVEKGTSFQDFRNGMLDMMKKSGWYGGAGHTEKEKKYINWRIGVIYDTNMKTAYAQAQYRDQLQGAALRPIWVYQSQLTGDNRRQEHIALHGKAFRYDDKFWDTHYPPNGWGCECYVNTESEYSAEKTGVKVEDSENITFPEIDPTWAYNVGREALAPNFSKFEALRKHKMNDGKSALSHVVEKYRQDMDGNRMTLGEFNVLLSRMNDDDYTPNKHKHINYQVGNLEGKRHEAMMRHGVDDSKIMSTDERLYHGTGSKNEDQKIKTDQLESVYETLQTPERIYENIKPKSKRFGREFHFVKDMKSGKVIKIVLRQTAPGTALQITTMGCVEDQYKHEGTQYEKIW